MNQPKGRTGRPRKRPYAAHDARAVALRANNAAGYLRQLDWCLQGHPEVANHFAMVAPEWAMYWRQHKTVMLETLHRLLASLDNPVAPDEGSDDVSVG